MNKIVTKYQFSQNVFQFDVEAPLIARSRRPGHFVIIRVDDHSERVPLTIAGADEKKGTIQLIVQQMGVSTHKLCALNEGDYIADVVGPLGKATDIEYFGTVICACGGVGAAPMLPIATALKEKGNKVITILAARNASLIILEEQLRDCSDEVIIMTDDGSMGTKGLVTQGVEEVIKREKVDKCITIGPAIMMKFVALTTAKYNVPTIASLNTIMVDGTGMCGACRVTVDGKTKFVCIDGPEFDAHQVDFDGMLTRLGMYKGTEKDAYQQYQDTTEKVLTAKERSAIERVKMPEEDPAIRAKSLTCEVNKGLSTEQALIEAQRCLNCPKPTCVQGCPVNINIPAFIHQVSKNDINKAYAVISENSLLPAICGRVCPQERQCEAQCIYHKMHKDPVAIGYLERYVADHVTKGSEEYITPNNIKVAVIGSGPSGLSCAGELARYGYDITVFEALHELGGVLRYGIPAFRLPNSIVDNEINTLRQKGVHFITDTIIGKTITMDELKQQGFKAIFVGTGAGLPKFMNIPGENSNGVFSANEFLTRVNLMDATNPYTDTPVLRGKNVLVIGGGNTAMDAARTALRIGSEKVTIVYRRSMEEMPARVEEVRHAQEEGIIFMNLHNPIEYHTDDNGRVSEAVLQVMTLGEPDASGRRSPVPVEGKTVTIPADMVIVAVGVTPNPIIPQTTKNLKVSPKRTIVVDDTLQTTIPTVFAGGDIVRGGATVILAMSDGKKAAQQIHQLLTHQ